MPRARSDLHGNAPDDAPVALLPVDVVNDLEFEAGAELLSDALLEGDVRGHPIARLLAPADDDYFVLKPKHSGFHATPLALLLEHLGTRTLVLTGFTAERCVLFTANDAYMRDFRWWCRRTASPRPTRTTVAARSSTCAGS